MSNGDSHLTPPERIQWEIDRCADVDLPVERAQDDEVWILRFRRRYQGTDRDFRAEFPVDHPELAPFIYGPPGLLPRHETPDGSLCVVDNLSNWWRPWFPLVTLIRELDALLAANEQGPEAVAAGEVPTSEPVTAYLNYRNDRTILVPDELLADQLGASGGSFRLRRLNSKVWIVSEVYDTARNKIAGAEPAVQRLTRDDGAIGGWVELEETPSVVDLEDALKTASKRALQKRGERKSKSARSRTRRQLQTHVTGVTFFEEGPARGQRRRTWIFAETEKSPGGGVSWVQNSPFRVQAISARQRQQRIPELEGLAAVRIVVVGAGSLGSQTALELAKAGVGMLDIIDPDVYEPGNSVRHVLTIESAGMAKAVAVAELCRSLNPFCVAHGHPDLVGRLRGDSSAVRELLAEADLLIDTTGSHTVTRLLRKRASATGATVVSAALSVGGYGGRAVVLRAGGPCWDCFLRAQEAGTIPFPDEGPRDDRTPFGCAHPVASCAGFEVTHLAAVTTRMAVQAFAEVAYPPLDHDWAVVNFRPGSRPVEQGMLVPDGGCPLPVH